MPAGNLEESNDPHALKKERFLKNTDTDPLDGLPEKKAARRLKECGRNRLAEHEERSLLKILFGQFLTPVMYLLAAAASLSFIFGDIPEGIAIVTVMLINVAIGFWMEFQARRSMDALKEMDKLTARVVRDGEEKDIDAEEVVPGDVVLLVPGALVPADLRLLEVSELQINESPLTGESVPASKNTSAVEEDAQTGDRLNMAYKGTSVTRGKARGIVTATGMDTEIGNISELVSSAGEEDIPLNRRLEELSRNLIRLVLGLALLLTVAGYLTEKDLYQIAQTSIAWAIAAIPEGLAIVASVALARGMLRLAEHHVIVKRLASVETLGETNTIFTDKTGTLTQNRLTVEEIILGTKEKGSVRWNDDEVTLDSISRDSESFRRLVDTSVLANDSDYRSASGEPGGGDPLDVALLRFARAVDEERAGRMSRLEIAAEDPFDHESKMMATVHRDGDSYLVSAKGATESILPACTRRMVEGKVSDLAEDDRKRLKEENDAMAESGLRILAFAFREESGRPSGMEEQEFVEDMVFTGLIGFADPPAEGVKTAIETFHEAGIEVVMVTGDHPGTALDIARRVSLAGQDEDHVIHGRELRDRSLDNRDIVSARIFARVDPEQKLDLVDSFQDQGKIVGMTGDGVNDTPALKKADIGIAMGRRGTQAAREVADMVLTDDAFPSILEAVRQGRIIFGNIRKFIIYQLSYHFSEILVIAAVMLILFELALRPLQLLFLNILLDVFPALALGIGRGRPEVMKEPPKDPSENIITGQNWATILTCGAVMAAAVSGVYFYGRHRMDLSSDIANNVAFYALAFAQLLNVFNMRDPEENIFFNQITRNKWVWMALALCIAALLCPIFIPGLGRILSLQPMGGNGWLLVLIGAVTPFLVIQTLKNLKKWK